LTKSHYRTEQAGLRLVHHIAPAVTVALDLYQNKRDSADGMKAPGETAGRGESDNSTTEAATLEGEKWDLKIEEIIDTIESIEISVGHLAKLTIGIDRTPAAGEEKRCSDGQRLYGRVLAWSNNDQCMELPVKMGMCEAHYRAFYRYRTDQHLPVVQYFEDAK
jgi:hypothetical protein